MTFFDFVQIFRDMNKTTDSLYSSSCVYHDKSPVFAFTNENVAGYISSDVNLGGKSVLSVAASGDQAFEALSAGASRVDTFDINSNQRIILELKSKMIRGLSYDNFMDFFFSRPNMFNPQILRPIMSGFSHQLQMFLISCYMNTRVIRDYSTDCPYFVSYISDRASYEALRNKMPADIEFTHTDITGLSAKFDRKYDLILLSNICESMYPREENALTVYKRFYNEVLTDLAARHLNGGGRICFDYLFSMLNVPDAYFYDYWARALDALKRSLGPSCPDEFSLRRVPSTCTPGHVDLVMTMQRGR